MILNVSSDLTLDTLRKAYKLMQVSKTITEYLEEHGERCPYVFSNARGHEAIQLAMGLQIKSQDFLFPAYRDEALMLGLGTSTTDLFAHLFAREDSPFSAGKNYYGAFGIKKEGYPFVPFTADGKGLHVIQAVGMAQGIQYLQQQNIGNTGQSVVVCSLTDAFTVGGEIYEAMEYAALHKLPVLFFVQDNEWNGSSPSEETRDMDAYFMAGGIKGLNRQKVHGGDFVQAYDGVYDALKYVRNERMPMLIQAKCPLLADYSSELKKSDYRSEEDIEAHKELDPIPRLQKYLYIEGETDDFYRQAQNDAKRIVESAFEQAIQQEPPQLEKAFGPIFRESQQTQESGARDPAGAQTISYRQAAVNALEEILRNHPEAYMYGEDIGLPLGGFYNEAQNLAMHFGEKRVFNVGPHSLFSVGSMLGSTLAGAMPIVSLPQAEKALAGIHQLSESLAKTHYLTDGQINAPVLLRVLTGYYPGAGPYRSESIASKLLTIQGIKVAFPSSAADMKGIMKAAFNDPNPVIVLEHKALYEASSGQSPEPDSVYCLPLGKARVVQQAAEERQDEGYSCAVITYGMGVHWAKAASQELEGALEILDLVTLHPLDWEAVVEAVGRHNKALVLTEEPLQNSFAEALAGRISRECFQSLDAPVFMVGSEDVPAIPLNEHLAEQILPSAAKVKAQAEALLNY